MKNISLQALVRALREEQNIDLPGNQEKIDVAEPKGKITAADFKKLRSMKKEGQYKHSIDQLLKIVQTKKAGPEYKKALMDLINLAKKKTGKEIHSIADLKQALDYEEPKIREGADHEVAMAMSSLKEIVSNASQLMDKLGGMERDIPGWIQDHITNAENYIEQANQGFHELEENMNISDVSDIKNEQELINTIEDIISSDIYIRDVPYSMRDGDTEIDPNSITNTAKAIVNMLKQHRLI